MTYCEYPLPIPSVSENVAKKLVEKGTFGSLPLGILFALAFCPVSAALFFGGLIPIAVKAHSGIGLPLIYGIGTGLPVLLFAFLVAAGTGYINNLYYRITKIEFYTKKVTALFLSWSVFIIHWLMFLKLFKNRNRLNAEAN